MADIPDHDPLSSAAQAGADGNPEDAESFDFVKRYFGFLAAVGSIPLLTGAVGFLEPPQSLKPLSVLASLFSVVVFGTMLHLRAIFASIARKHWQLLVLVLLTLASLLACASVTSEYIERTAAERKAAQPGGQGNVPVGVPQGVRLDVLLYLAIHSSLASALGLMVVVAFNLKRANTIQGLVWGALRDEAGQIENRLANLARFYTISANSPFRPLGEKLVINPYTQGLEMLASGKFAMAESRAYDLYDAVLDTFGKSFNAISDNHLHFWDPKSRKESARKYLDRNFEAVKNGAHVNRVFLFSDDELAKWETVAEVLEEQDGRGLGWGVVPYATLDPSAFRSSGEPLDFALFNFDQAISYFRTYDGAFKNYDVFLAVNEVNRKRLIEQGERYLGILMQAWFVNQKLVEDLPNLAKGLPQIDQWRAKTGSAPRADEELINNFALLGDRLKYETAHSALKQAEMLRPELIGDRKEKIQRAFERLQTIAKGGLKRDPAVSDAGPAWEDCFLLGTVKSPDEIVHRSRQAVMLRRLSQDWRTGDKERTPRERDRVDTDGITPFLWFDAHPDASDDGEGVDGLSARIKTAVYDGSSGPRCAHDQPAPANGTFHFQLWRDGQQKHAGTGTTCGFSSHIEQPGCSVAEHRVQWRDALPGLYELRVAYETESGDRIEEAASIEFPALARAAAAG